MESQHGCGFTKLLLESKPTVSIHEGPSRGRNVIAMGKRALLEPYVSR
jgi:hypothetical protein